MRNSTKTGSAEALRALALVFTCCAALHADYSYRVKTQIAGVKPGIKQVLTILIKGNRMASIAKDRIDVFDLDKQTITSIDLAMKTYEISTFEQRRPAERAFGVKFNVSVRATDAVKKIGVLNTKGMVLTAMNGAANITVDAWIATVPGYDDVREFQRALGEKMGYEFDCGLPRIGSLKPKMLPAIAQVCREVSKIQGAPLQITLRMAESGTVAMESTIGGTR